MGILSTLSWMNYNLVTGLGNSADVFYFGAVVGFLGISSNVAVRSIISKTMNSKTNGGMLFSLLASIEALVPLVFSPLIVWLYSRFLGVFPGIVYLVTSGVLLLNILIFTLIFLKKGSNKDK